MDMDAGERSCRCQLHCSCCTSTTNSRPRPKHTLVIFRSPIASLASHPSMKAALPVTAQYFGNAACNTGWSTNPTRHHKPEDCTSVTTLRVTFRCSLFATTKLIF